MNINRNTMGHLEVPDFILAKASGERVGALQCTNKIWAKKYNDMDTLSFEIPYMKDDVLTKFYDDIDIMKYIEVPSLSASFAIKDISIENEGQKTEFKKIECQSRECALGQKYLIDFSINTGTTGSLDGISFCNSGVQTKSLLHLVLEKFPDWSISYVTNTLQTMKRSFEVTRQPVYDFLVNDVSEAFECIFIFDSLNKTISAYTQEEYGIDSNIHVSYNALLQNTSMDYSIDDIKTAVTLTGESDDVTVREINMGYDTIYDFSAYASEEYMSSSLLSAYNTWKNLVNTTVNTSLFKYKTGVITQAELQGKTYKQAYTILLTKYQDLYTQISQWTSTKMPYGINTRKNPGYGTISYTADGSDAVVIEKQTATELVTSLPSTGVATTLYLVKNTNNMYRWKNKWINVNDWKECCLKELQTLQSSAEKLQAVAMKKGWGDGESTDTTIQARYIDTYLPPLYMYNALTKQIATVKSTISTLETNQENYIQYDKNVIVEKTAMRNNFTAEQLKELSTFIREEELSSSNFLVTDEMTEDERFEMLYALLDYGQKELAKVATPQIQFSASLNNLFAIPEFDTYSGDFDIGNYVWVTLRDDYSIKAKILEMEIDFLDQSNFSVTFGNIMKKAKNIFTDVTEALNAATSAATSVSFNSSYWSASAEETNSIGKALADGLLSQSYYLASPDDNETLIDQDGVWITTVSGNHGRESTDNFDAIYLGGGRMLFTSDGWRSVRMSVGRADVMWPYVENGQLVTKKESRFGVFADFLLAGYVAGSYIVGGDIYSDNYKTNSSNKNSGNYGTHINLTDGTFEFNSKTSPGKKRLTLNSSGELEVNGTIHAKAGNIGSDDNGSGGFIIENLRMYSGKTAFNDPSHTGIYFGSDSRSTELQTNGISLGKYGAYKTGKNPFSVDMAGNLVANHGEIANFILTGSSLYTKTSNVEKKALDTNAKGVYIGSDGIGLGKTTTYTTTTAGESLTKSKFQVDDDGNLFAGSVNVKGRITATTGYIGTESKGFTITSSSIYNGKTSLTDLDHDGVYIGTYGISLGRINTGTSSSPTYADAFKVTSGGVLTSKSGNIGGWTIGNNTISHTKSSGTNKGTITISAVDNTLDFNGRIKINGDGSFSAAGGLFTIDTGGKMHATAGDIGGFTISEAGLYKSKTSLDDLEHSGVYIGTTGISLGRRNVGTSENPNYVDAFKVTSGGILTSTRGTIGGWTIGEKTLSADNITISSEGSISSYKDSSHNWWISSDGTASFKSVYISDVQKNSNFGSIGYDGSNTWGTFGSTSYFKPTNTDCFADGAVTQIKNLAVGQITADNINAAHASIESLYFNKQAVTWSNLTYVTSVSVSCTKTSQRFLTGFETSGSVTLNDGRYMTVYGGGVYSKMLEIPTKITISYKRKTTTVMGATNADDGESDASSGSIKD